MTELHPAAARSPGGEADAAGAVPFAAEWDAFLLGVPGGDQVQSSGWADARRLAGLAVDYTVIRRDGRIVAGAQVFIRRLPLIGLIGYVPYGPLGGEDDPDLADLAVCELERYARDHHVRGLIVQPPAFGEAAGAALRAHGHVPSPFEVAPSATLRASLDSEMEGHFAALRTSVRRNIRLTANAGVTTHELAAHELETFYALYRATAERRGFEPTPLARLRQELEILGPSGGLRMFVAELRGEPLAGLLLGCFGRTVTYRLPGLAGPGDRLRPADLLIWETMRWAAQQGFTTFDFGGVPRGYAVDLLGGQKPGDWPERGAAEFKRGFHGEALLYPEPYAIIPNRLLRAAFRRFTNSPAAVQKGRALLNWLRRH